MINSNKEEYAAIIFVIIMHLCSVSFYKNEVICIWQIVEKWSIWKVWFHICPYDSLLADSKPVFFYLQINGKFYLRQCLHKSPLCFNRIFLKWVLLVTSVICYSQKQRYISWSDDKLISSIIVQAVVLLCDAHTLLNDSAGFTASCLFLTASVVSYKLCIISLIPNGFVV